jgi:phosphate transport system permease protein
MTNRVHRRATELLLAVAVSIAPLGVCALFAWIFLDLVWRGGAHLSWSLLTELPSDAGRAGGILPILVSTGLILVVSLSAAVPLSIATAAWLAEFSEAEGAFSRWVRASLDVLAGVPSVVFGLFGSAFFCQFLGLGFSILSGGLTLACMILPILTRATEEGFRAVSIEHRSGAAALGLSPVEVLFHVTLPLAAPAVTVGLVLGIGRALAETAALVFTSGYVDRMPESLGDSGRALSIHIFDLAMNVPGGDARAAASALVLITAVLGVNLLAAQVMRSWSRARTTEETVSLGAALRSVKG